MTYHIHGNTKKSTRKFYIIIWNDKKNQLSKESLRKKFNSILLVQSYNEERNISLFLRRNSVYFDAIILLDDDSQDQTYSLAQNPKIILKVKKERNSFNDIKVPSFLIWDKNSTKIFTMNVIAE